MTDPLVPPVVHTLVHTRVPFQLVVPLPFEEAVPLFGAWAEKAWDSSWNPEFIFPLPPADQEGAVFRISHAGSLDAIWVNSVFDLAAGHVQYVVLLGHEVVTRIDIHLAPEGQGRTAVSVVYERTALDPDANAQVTELAQGDSEKAPLWQGAIESQAALRRKGAGR